MAPQVRVPQDGPPRQVVVHVPESPMFAVVTLLCYIFVYPVGVILNIVGLFTGPKRGCFVAMFLVGFLLPMAILVLLVVTGIAVSLLEQSG
ncbi:MAG: hypothetical protein ACODAJ_09485 [Planctomycetota bacterium]